MIFLDTDADYLMTGSRAEMVQALLAYLPDEPDDATLATLAAACLGLSDPLEVSVLEKNCPHGQGLLGEE